MKYKKLSKEEENVIVNKGTELPFTGKYVEHFENGVYVCKQCATPLYLSKDKFPTTCGWPAFDDEIPNAIKRVKNPFMPWDEIQCAKCGAHLGHVFEGEFLTPKNVRHCVNSISLDFIPVKETKNKKR